MPLWLIEIALAIGLICVSIRILKMGFVNLVGRITARVLAALIASGVLWLSVWVIDAVIHNIVLRLAVAAALGVGVYIVACHMIVRGFRRTAGDAGNKPAWATRLIPRLSPGINRTLCAASVAALWLGAVIALDVAGELLSVSNWRIEAQRHTLVLRWFLTPLPPPPGQRPLANAESRATSRPGGETPQQTLDAQQRFLSGIGRNIAGAREYIARATGTQAMAAQIQALRTITNLSYEDRAWILRNNPAVLALINDPAIDRVLHNPRVFDLVDQVSAGSLTAIYQLGEEPDIQRLLDDDRVRPLLTKIDPAEMVRQLQEHRQTQARPVEVAWSWAKMTQPTQLDAMVTNKAAWATSPDATGEGQRWPAGTRWGVLATTHPPSPGGPTLLTLQTPGQPVVWWAGKSIQLTGVEGHWLASLPACAKATPLEISIDFRGATGEPFCRIWLGAPD